jgi:hypothetical protein
MNMSEKVEVPVSPLSDFEHLFLNRIGVLELNDASNKPLMFKGKRVKVELYGPNTPEQIKALAYQRQWAMTKATSQQAQVENKPAVDFEESREVDIKYLVDVTKDFVNFPYPGGKQAIYSNPDLCYIEPQVRKYLANWGNFMRQQSNG